MASIETPGREESRKQLHSPPSPVQRRSLVLTRRRTRDPQRRSLPLSCRPRIITMRRRSSAPAPPPSYVSSSLLLSSSSMVGRPLSRAHQTRWSACEWSARWRACEWSIGVLRGNRCAVVVVVVRGVGGAFSTPADEKSPCRGAAPAPAAPTTSFSAAAAGGSRSCRRRYI